MLEKMDRFGVSGVELRPTWEPVDKSLGFSFPFDQSLRMTIRFYSFVQRLLQERLEKDLSIERGCGYIISIES